MGAGRGQTWVDNVRIGFLKGLLVACAEVSDEIPEARAWSAGLSACDRCRGHAQRASYPSVFDDHSSLRARDWLGAVNKSAIVFCAAQSRLALRVADEAGPFASNSCLISGCSISHANAICAPCPG